MNIVPSDTPNSDNTPTPFINKLYELVNDENAKQYICWSHEANRPGFVVLEPVQLSTQILPKYFKHSNFSSFVRQLNIYGFHKIDHPNGQCFHHQNFKEGHPELLSLIHRQQPKKAEAENEEMYKSLLTKLQELQCESIDTANHIQQFSNALYQLKNKIEEMEERMQSLTQTLYCINTNDNPMCGNRSSPMNQKGMGRPFGLNSPWK